MSHSRTRTRALAPLIAVLTALAALTAFSVSAAPPADAAGAKLKIVTKGPYKKHQTIKVKLTGFPANAQIALGICPSNIDPNGPGDCGSPGLGYSRLTVANAKGKLVTTLRVPKGRLGSTLRPKEKCGNKKKDKCSVFASVTSGGVSLNTKPLKYA